MNKSDLRTRYKSLRAQLTAEEIEEKSLAIANQLLQVDIWNKTYYHLFLSIVEQKEIDTEFILQILAGKDKEIVLAKSDFKTGEMTHFLLTDNTKIKKNNYNIPEPVNGLEVPVSKIDVVFVPLLAFDKKGHRVGYGKGFYDRFLTACNPETLKIGLSFFEAKESIEGTSANDIPLDYVVTPEKVYFFD